MDVSVTSIQYKSADMAITGKNSLKIPAGKNGEPVKLALSVDGSPAGEDTVAFGV
jgi:hypothetical protein